MPFSTDEAWPDYLHEIFTVSRDAIEDTFLTTPENRYSAFYNSLLYYAVISDGLIFCPFPQNPLEPCDAVALGSSLAYKNLASKIVLLVEIKDHRWLKDAHKRQKADTLMRKRIGQMLHECPFPHLYGLSVLGTSLCVYRGDKDTNLVTPQFVEPPDPEQTSPADFLEDQWDVDILSPDGFRKMKEVVGYIMTEQKKIPKL